MDEQRRVTRKGQPEPLTQLGEAAASMAEQYDAYTSAGIPPMVAAVMLGQMLGVMATQGSGVPEPPAGDDSI